MASVSTEGRTARTYCAASGCTCEEGALEVDVLVPGESVVFSLSQISRAALTADDTLR